MSSPSRVGWVPTRSCRCSFELRPSRSRDLGLHGAHVRFDSVVVNRVIRGQYPTRRVGRGVQDWESDLVRPNQGKRKMQRRIRGMHENDLGSQFGRRDSNRFGLAEDSAWLLAAQKHAKKGRESARWWALTEHLWRPGWGGANVGHMWGMTTTICRWIWSAISMAGLLAVTAVPSTASDAENYYSSTCPEATTIVRNMVTGFVKQNRNLAGALQRLHFHDCFVRVNNRCCTDPPESAGSRLIRSFSSNALLLWLCWRFKPVQWTQISQESKPPDVWKRGGVRSNWKKLLGNSDFDM